MFNVTLRVLTIFFWNVLNFTRKKELLKLKFSDRPTVLKMSSACNSGSGGNVSFSTCWKIINWYSIQVMFWLNASCIHKQQTSNAKTLHKHKHTRAGGSSTNARIKNSFKEITAEWNCCSELTEVTRQIYLYNIFPNNRISVAFVMRLKFKYKTLLNGAYTPFIRLFKQRLP